jgi:hypothetical protein
VSEGEGAQQEAPLREEVEVEAQRQAMRCPVNIRTDGAVWATNEKRNQITAPFAALPINIAAFVVLAVIWFLFSLAVFATLIPTPASAALNRPYLSQLTGTPSGPFGGVCGVTVDPASQDIYVATGNAIDIFSSSGTYKSQIPDSAGCSVAVDDSTGNVYVAVNEAVSGLNEGRYGLVYEYDSSGKYIGILSAVETPIKAEYFGGIDTDVAVDQTSGDVYVSTSEPSYYLEQHSGVYKFDSSGKYISDITGFPPETPVGIAVHSSGNLYIGTGNAIVEFNSSGAKVNEFPAHSHPNYGGNPLGFGDNRLVVASLSESLVEEFDSSGTPIGETSGSNTPADFFGQPEGVAVSANGNMYVADRKRDIVDVLGPPAILPDSTTGEVSELTPTTVTLNGHVDPAGGPGVTECHFELIAAATYAGNGANFSSGATDVPCEQLLPISSATDVTAKATGLAPNTAYDIRLLAAGSNGAEHGSDEAFETRGPATTGEESAVSVTKIAATLQAQVDPHGIATTYSFQYVDEADFKSGGFSNPATVTTPESSSIGEGFSPQPVSAVIEALSPETTYHFRVLATSECEPVTHPVGQCLVEGEDATFTTLPPLRIDSTSVTEVTSTSAVFGGLVDPLGLVASYRFEYLTEAEYQMNVAEGVEGFAGALRVPSGAQGDALIASSEEDEGVSQLAEGLEPATVYRYRLVAVNPTVPVGVPGPGEVFRTEGAGSGVALVDGRAWEMVSPPDKHGVGLEPFGLGVEGGLLQAAEGGGAFAYIAKAPIDAEPAGDRSIEFQQLLARRGAGGWSTQDITTPNETVVAVKGGFLSEYKFFSSDLSSALVEPEGATPLSPLASEWTPYLRDDNECEATSAEAIPATCYTPLVNPGNVSPGTKFGSEEHLGGREVYSGVQFVAATPDLSHIILKSPYLNDEDPNLGSVQLTSTPNPGGVYEWSGGQLQPLEFGAPSLVDHALSDDGSSFFDGGGHLFLHDFTKDESVRLDVAQGVAEPAVGDAAFFYASSDGSRVLFSDSEQLTTAPGGGVYECRVVEDACGELVLTDLSPSGSLLGGSVDASYLYFVSGGTRVEEANDGEYVTGGRLEVAHYEDGAWTMTVGPLLTEFSLLSGHSNQAFRISPNGRFLAFMSQASLTGFDNRDAASGVPDQEVYEYDAASDRLVCASCNPTGARPVGMFDHEESEPNGHGGFDVFLTPLVDKQELWTKHWLAGSIPGLTSVGNGQAFDQPRYLNDSGRLFFDSPVGLVPGDANGREDVYEYEPEGVGSCTSSTSTGTVVYVKELDGQPDGGCVALISSGTSSEESVFLDASESGEDVFFMTAAKLAPQDVDNAIDVYDAHVCPTASPCPAGAVSVPPACTTVDSCRAANPPQPTIFGAPPSATFNGAGNLTPVPPAKPAPPSAAQVRAKHLEQALSSCKKRFPHNKKRRTTCERTAHKKFGVVRTK